VAGPGEYSHTQRAPLHLLLWALALGFASIPGWSADLFAIPWVTTGAIALSVLTGVLALCFKHLKIESEEGALRIRFGPLPLFQRKIALERIRAARATRSSLIEGWGIHLGPHGWIWNLWGFDCVELDLDRGKLRIGTDDPDGLVAFITEHCPAEPGAGNSTP